MVMAKLQPKTDKANEPRDDIRVPCTRIVTHLSKQVHTYLHARCKAARQGDKLQLSPFLCRVVMQRYDTTMSRSAMFSYIL